MTLFNRSSERSMVVDLSAPASYPEEPPILQNLVTTWSAREQQDIHSTTNTRHALDMLSALALADAYSISPSIGTPVSRD